MGTAPFKYYYPILWQFCCFFFLLKLFGTNNDEKGYFNQRLECWAPKKWSKYTAIMCQGKHICCPSSISLWKVKHLFIPGKIKLVRVHFMSNKHIIFWRGKAIRPKLDNRINKKQMTKFFWPVDPTIWPNLTTRPNLEEHRFTPTVYVSYISY